MRLSRISYFQVESRTTPLGWFFLSCAEGQNRTGDTLIFSQVLYQLSYLGERSDCTLATEGCQACGLPIADLHLNQIESSKSATQAIGPASSGENQSGSRPGVRPQHIDYLSRPQIQVALTA